MCSLRSAHTPRFFYLGLRLLPSTGQYAYAVRYCALRNTRTLRGYVLAPLRAYAALFLFGAPAIALYGAIRLCSALLRAAQYAHFARLCARSAPRIRRAFLLSPICRYTLIALSGLTIQTPLAVPASIPRQRREVNGPSIHGEGARGEVRRVWG